VLCPILTINYARWRARYTICPADNATAGRLGRRRAGQLRFGFVAVSVGHVVYSGSEKLRLLHEFTFQTIKLFF
jgi:hypothetical protein